VPVLTSWLDGSRAEQRQAALLALGEIADERALSHVEQSLRDPLPASRLAAVQAVGEYLARGRAPATLLTASLSDSEPSVRLAAVSALTSDAPPPPTASSQSPAPAAQSSDKLLAALNERARDPDAEVRSQALRALAQREGARSLP